MYDNVSLKYSKELVNIDETPSAISYYDIVLNRHITYKSSINNL